MCDERERLIGYVYDECAPDERAEIQAHLSTCSACQDEIAGLRAVRRDLLAWEVPEYTSVWRPFVSPPRQPSWRDVPAWAMAAAAGAMLMAGAAGGVATRALLAPDTPVVVPMAAAAPAGPVGAAAVTSDDLAALEQRLRTEIRAEMEQEMTQRVAALASEHDAVVAQVRNVTAAARRPAASEDVQAALAQIQARLGRSDDLWTKQVQLNQYFEDRTLRLQNEQIESRVPTPTSMLKSVNFTLGGQ